ncbi:hypothetical protein KI387_019516, partial [Taxus chinensis]
MSRWTGADPCSSNWVGIICDGSRVADVDLSYNPDLTGLIPSSLGNFAGLLK